jgi:uncharacterized membrane protein YvbJ
MVMRKGKRRGDLHWDHLIPWMIAIFALVLFFAFSFLLKDNLASMVKYIKNLFR